MSSDATRLAKISFEQLIDSLLERDVGVEFYLPTWNPVMYECCSNSEYSGGLDIENYIRKFAAQRNITARSTYNPIY